MEKRSSESEIENSLNESEQGEKRPIEIVIKRNNSYFTEWDRRIREEGAQIQRMIDDRANGIEPDPDFVKKLRDRLIMSGILDEQTGGLGEMYRRSEW